MSDIEARARIHLEIRYQEYLQTASCEYLYSTDEGSRALREECRHMAWVLSGRYPERRI